MGNVPRLHSDRKSTDWQGSFSSAAFRFEFTSLERPRCAYGVGEQNMSLSQNEDTNAAVRPKLAHVTGSTSPLPLVLLLLPI